MKDSLRISNVFRLVEQIRHDMADKGYCFVSEQRGGSGPHRDYLYLISDAQSQEKEFVTVDRIEMTSHHLRAYFQREQTHPRQRYAEFYDDQIPEMVLTYEWSLSFEKMQKYFDAESVKRARGSKLGSTTRVTNPEWWPLCTIYYIFCCCWFWFIPVPGSLPKDGRIWIDIFFVDQNSSNIHQELERAEVIYRHALYHVVFYTDTVLSRGWCLFELVTRKSENRESITLFAEMSPDVRQGANYFDRMEVSVPGDLVAIKDRILETCETTSAFDKSIDTLVKESQSSDWIYILVGHCFFWFMAIVCIPVIVCICPVAAFIRDEHRSAMRKALQEEAPAAPPQSMSVSVTSNADAQALPAQLDMKS